jgi:hypothetical protein
MAAKNYVASATIEGFTSVVQSSLTRRENQSHSIPGFEKPGYIHCAATRQNQLLTSDFTKSFIFVFFVEQYSDSPSTTFMVTVGS